jgi:hypothetical protein
LQAIEKTAGDFTEPPQALWESNPMQGQLLDESFTSGLRNIRDAIESRLKDSGIEKQSLGDTARACARTFPAMVIIDVGGNNKMARVTFTREEIEDCCQFVDPFCVRSKIDHVVAELLR